MNTTPAAEPAASTSAPAAPEPGPAPDHEDVLEALAAVDPAEAPEPAERLAADLAMMLETDGDPAASEQLAAFPDRSGEPS